MIDMVKRGFTVWVFSTLSIVAATHALDAILALFFSKDVVLLRLYPVIGALEVNPLSYLLASAGVTVLFWGFTCILVVETPVERFLNTVLSDAKRQTEIECDVVDDNRSMLDMICETITENATILTQTRDLTYNIKSELRELHPLTDKIEQMKLDLETLKKELESFKETVKKPNVCPSCGKIVLPRFKVCPYCGEMLHISPNKIILEQYK
jgi:ribosomal protein L32